MKRITPQTPRSSPNPEAAMRNEKQQAGYVLDSSNYYGSSQGGAVPLDRAGRLRPAAASGTKVPAPAHEMLQDRTHLSQAHTQLPEFGCLATDCHTLRQSRRVRPRRNPLVRVVFAGVDCHHHPVQQSVPQRMPIRMMSPGFMTSRASSASGISATRSSKVVVRACRTTIEIARPCRLC